MDIRQLQLFKHLATTLHFGHTSRACNITPSALTRTIQRLEETTGRKLFSRDRRTVRLTLAGRRFLQYAEEVLGQWQILQNDLATDEKILRGDVAIYCSVTAVYGILPQILGKFREVHPEVRIHLQTGDAASALPKLQNREVEVAIAALPEQMPGQLQFHQVMETPLLFIAPKSLPAALAGQEAIDWLQTPVIMAEKGVERQRLDTWFHDRRVQPQIYAQVAGNEAIIAMVSLGCGIGVVPALVLEKSPLRERISVLNVLPALPPLSVGVCILEKNRTNPIVEAFWNTAKKESGGGA